MQQQLLLEVFLKEIANTILNFFLDDALVDL